MGIADVRENDFLARLDTLGRGKVDLPADCVLTLLDAGCHVLIVEHSSSAKESIGAARIASRLLDEVL